MKETVFKEMIQELEITTNQERIKDDVECNFYKFFCR